MSDTPADTPAGMLRLKPAVTDTIVRNPDRAMRPLAADGELVPASAFWHRRLLADDVVDCDTAAAEEGEARLARLAGIDLTAT